MTVEIMQETSITDEARGVIWRIFGAGASPLTAQSSYELIAPVVKKHLNSKDAGPLIGEIQGWFESHGDRHWLKNDMRKAVASMILQGVRAERGKVQTWAVGSIDAEMAKPIVRSLWSCEEIDSFVRTVLDTLEEACKRDRVFDPSRLEESYSSYSTDAGILKDAIEREGRLETYRQINSYGFNIFYRAPYPAIGNLLGLVVELRPEWFESFIERLDHPMIQVRTALHMITKTRHLNHRETLRWIGHRSCDGLIALAIVHTLDTVNRLDEDIRHVNRKNADRYTLSTELRPPQDDLDAADDDLLDGLVDRLAVLDPLVCARWLGELLSGATYILYPNRDKEKPRRVSRLERKCTQLCARLFRDKWSSDLLSELIAGLRHAPFPRISWTRHMAEVAWEIRDAEPTRAAEIAAAAIDEHEQLIVAKLKDGHVSLEWPGWEHREWLSGLAIALVISCKELDLTCWVRAQCRPLPLSMWDAEENPSAFNSADHVVQHWFLVALHAIPILIELGRPADPAAVLALAESLQIHCRFAGTHLHTLPNASVVAEHASRSAIEYGEPSDVWLLDQHAILTSDRGPYGR